jgi:pimeloyl-ACP methyl ester carboxylesterase
VPDRLIAFDLPGFGLSDAFDYRARSLRSHAVAQLTSLLDALELERVVIVGTSLGGCGRSAWLSGPRIVSPQWGHSVSRPSRCPACTATGLHRAVHSPAAPARPGDEDPYGGPEIGRRACAVMPNARLEVISGRHAPFLDDPETSLLTCRA